MQEIETRDLPVRLTDHELKAKSDDLVSTLQELDRLRGERDSYLAAVKLAKDEFRSQEKELEKRMRGLGGEIATRSEQRPVECRLAYHWDLGRVDVVRNDLEETVDSRAITPEERQQQMPFQSPEQSQLKAVG